jgi:hypothetical protein
MNKKAKLFLSPLSADVPHPLSLLLFLPLNLYQKLALSLSASLNQKSQETLSSPSPALHPSLTFSLTTANGHLRRLPYLSLRRKGSGHSEEEWALLPLRRSCLSLSRAKSFRPPAKNGFWTNPSFWVSGFFSTNGGLGLLVFFIFYSFSYFEKFWAVFQPQNLFNIRLKKKLPLQMMDLQVMVSGGAVVWAGRMLWRAGTLWWESGRGNFWGKMERSEFFSSYAVSGAIYFQSLWAILFFF